MSDGLCLDCMRGDHDKCDGIEYVIDQDGHSRYMCQCHCNLEYIEERCRHCGGAGFKTVVSHTKNRKRDKAGS